MNTMLLTLMNALSLEHKLDDSSRYSNAKYRDRKANEESMSKIEAELKAEVERLESNINSSKLEGKLSNIAELHPNFASDVIMGDLRADLFGAKTDTQPYANRDGSGSSTPNSLCYPVSPKELSLRLHEVIQSRLEERIKELETALENSQRKVEQTESIEHRARQPYIQEDSPVVINLSGEALAAYNEAYEGFNKVSDSDEEDFPFGFEKSNHQEIFHQCKQVIDRVQNGGVNGYMDPIVIGSREMSNMVVCTSRDESEDGEDEMEKLLIKQIVEKVKQGSPAVFNAQRALL
ncbi:hypothetical protein ACJIZ3_020777 [Penstemon smallii]|uniref:Uncharacterized protein n=1 Tax=Penstemon smallii TaxID=265156 RepID=A0ABD3SK72_9LAMI